MGELATREKPFVRDNPPSVPGRITRESIKERCGIAPLGRPTLYSEALAEAICERIRKGAPPRMAVYAEGVGPDAYYEWLQAIPNFAVRVRQAEALSLIPVAEALQQAATTGDGKGDYKAAIELLKRRDRTHYGDTIDIRKVDTEQLMDMIRQQQDDAPPRVTLDTVEDVL